MTLEVIGAGFGRTGTLSLKLALEQLGFGPCCHGIEERHFLQGETFWERAFNREPINWDEYFRDYRATVDSPSCRFYQELARSYPNAKIILTLRDSSAWFKSYQETVLPIIMSSQEGRLCSFLFGNDKPSRESLIAAYEQHNAEVQRCIPAERLLLYHVRDGWPPLCEFLGVPIPSQPFPRSNLREHFPTLVDGIVARLGGYAARTGD